MRMDDNADAKRILLTSHPQGRRQRGAGVLLPPPNGGSPKKISHNGSVRTNASGLPEFIMGSYSSIEAVIDRSALTSARRLKFLL